MPKAKGQSLAEYALIMVLVALVTILALLIFDDWLTTDKFDQDFAANHELINAASIPLGTDSLSHPAATQLIEVPTGGDYLKVSPRLWTLEGCLEKRVNPNMTTLHAAIPVERAAADIVNLVTIQMPIPGGQVINICGPEGVTLEIILWYE